LSQLKIYRKKNNLQKPNLKHKCILQDSCKSRDVRRDLFYLSEEITALEIVSNLLTGITSRPDYIHFAKGAK